MSGSAGTSVTVTFGWVVGASTFSSVVATTGRVVGAVTFASALASAFASAVAVSVTGRVVEATAVAGIGGIATIQGTIEVIGAAEGAKRVSLSRWKSALAAPP